MKSIILIGATGYVGQALLAEFIERGFQVNAIARNTDKIHSSKLVTPIQMDITVDKQLENILKEGDIVVSAFNAGWSNPNLYDDFTKGINVIHQAVKNSNADRLIVMGGAGTLYVKTDLQLVDTPEFPAAIKPGATALRDYFQNTLSKETEFKWTYFSPAIEMNPGNPGERTGHYRLGVNSPVFDCENRSRISVQDVAVAIADEITTPQFINRQFTIGY